MGLDSFKSDGSKSTYSGSTSDTKEQESEQTEEDAFKVFSASDGRKKVFQSEEDWNEAIEFIENNLGMTEDEVVGLNPTRRHDVLHQAIMGEEGNVSQDFYPTRECIVCGDEFSFPTKWNFSKFKGETVCNDHKISEVLKAYREINELHGVE